MSSRPSLPVLSRALLVVGLLTALPALAADQLTFARGSLIIPEQASFQRGCGALSAYGLVWRILQANQPGGANAANPVTVYLAINDQKQSPNRCVPSNRHTAPNPPSDSRWNDGCDFTITNSTEQPVVQVDYSVAFPASGIYPYGNIQNFTTDDDDARPYFNAQTLNNTVTNPRFTTVRYMGGAFIIAAADAPRVINLIRAGSGASSLEIFRTHCTNDCSSFSSPSNCHYVRMHQATIEFTAPIARRINRVPPKIALLDRDDVPDSNGEPPNGTNYVKGGMLDDYLRNAGLGFTGAGGCPQGTTNPSCTAAPGLIYDALHANRDLISTATHPRGLLNALDPVTGKPRYQVFWAPHWELGPTNHSGWVPGDGSTTQVENVLNNIAYFADQRGRGVFAECASIHSYESSFRINGAPILSSRFQSENDSFQKNSLGGSFGGIFNTWDGRNCTDPDYLNQSIANRGRCMIYPNPGDPFSQIGDFKFNSVMGHTTNYRATYKPGVRRLSVSWVQYQVTHQYDRASDISALFGRGHDFFSFNQKDNDPDKATIVYLAGHDFQDSVAGTRIVLNTLLNLGAEPISRDRAVAAPVAFDDLNGSHDTGTRALVLAATYKAVTGYPPGADTYEPAVGSQWVFPYYPGNLRAHPLIGGPALAAGESDLDAATLWDADSRLPLPGARNLFTYFGGEVKANPSLGIGRSAPRGVMQVGWQPETVAGDAINSNYGAAPNPNCVDVLKLGQATTRTGQPTYDFVPDPSGDGICDLQQAVQFTPQDPGSDFGVSTASTNKQVLQNDFSKVAQMLQRVRGFCVANVGGNDGAGAPILTPTNAQCNDPDADNRAHLGGFAHSTPAVVQPSKYIPDAGARRPTVAYAGGLDGQLHAFYVSGGSGYTGPAGGLSFPNPSAASKFRTDWATRFQNGTLPLPGTELWSFLPATQLPWLKNNAARVNSAPVVLDVFADFVGSGKREWHTVLVANVGQTGRDLFALDVTNPLRPVLLWHLVGSHAQTGTFPPHAPVSLADRPTGGTQWAVKWHEPTALFLMAPSPDVGRLPTGLYDYSELGGARGLSMGVVRQGMEPTYTVFVASSSSGANSAPGKGIEVFALDAATGQKLWQWEQPYTQAWVDNTPPIAPTVMTDPGGAARVYVGDMEGRVWELEGATGMNTNVVRLGPACSQAVPCKYAALDTGSTQAAPKPISTNVALARLPRTMTQDSAFAAYPGELVALVGTGGTDWVSSSAPGTLHVALLERQRRRPMGTPGTRLNGTAVSAEQAHLEAGASGVLQEPPPFPRAFNGPRHLYGNITVAGRTAYFSTADAPVSDLMSLSGNTSGATWRMDLGNTATSASTAVEALPGLALANFGGVTVYHQSDGATSRDFVVGLEVSKISNTIISNDSPKGASSPDADQKPNQPNGFAFRLLNWAQRYLE